MRKNVISRADIIYDGDMSGDITGEFLDVLHLDNIDFLVHWSGASPVGEIRIQVTNDDINNSNITPSWKDLNFSTNIIVSTDNGNDLISIREVPGRYIRFKYVFTSGTGSMFVSVTGRMI